MGWVSGIFGTIGVLAFEVLLLALIIYMWRSYWSLNDGFASALEYATKFVLMIVLVVGIIVSFMLGISWAWSPLMAAR